MHPELRKRFIRELTADILGLNPTFESFCGVLLGFLAGASWWHRGITKEGAPIGRTVDSHAHGAAWVGQYSAAKDYFAEGLTKLKGDIAHARSLHADAEILWALSNQECSAMQSTAVAAVVAGERAAGLDVRVLDSRQIATFIVDELHNERMADALQEYLPTLRRVRYEYAASHRIPEYPGYVSRPRFEADVLEAMSSRGHVLISGIGGSGKSALCSALATRSKENFELVLWVDAADIRRAEDLSSIDVLRNGLALNVRGMLQTRPCLVVLDNLVVSLDLVALMADAHTGSRLLATSQTGTSSSLAIGELQPDEARAVLDPDGTCPPEVASAIVAAVGGHPLILSVLSTIAREDGEPWSKVLAYVPTATSLEDKRGRICDQILGSHRKSLDRAFLLVHLAGARIDEALWDSIAGLAARRAFQRRHFLAAGGPRIVRVHDVIAASIQRLYVGTDTASMVSDVSAFLREQMLAVHSMTIQRTVRYHFSLLAELLRSGSKDAAIRYGYAMSRRTGMDLALLGDPLAFADDVRRGGDVEASVRAILESIECANTITSEMGRKDSAKTELKRVLPAFDMMLQVPHLPATLQRDIRHHHAKALDRIGLPDEARAAFERVVADDPNFPAARLQLARVLAKPRGDAVKALEQLESVFAYAEWRLEDIDLSVVLGAFETLSWKTLSRHLPEVVLAHKALLFASLGRALQYGHEQPYKLIAQLGYSLPHNIPQLYIELFNLIPHGLVAPESEREIFTWAQTLKAVGKAERELGATDYRQYFEDASRQYALLRDGDEFIMTHAAECASLLHDWNGALNYLLRVPADNRNAHWHYQAASAMRHRDTSKALQHIDQALELAKDDPNTQGRFAATFLEERYRIRRSAGDVDAASDLHAAIAISATATQREALERELAMLSVNKSSPHN